MPIFRDLIWYNTYFNMQKCRNWFKAFLVCSTGAIINTREIYHTLYLPQYLLHSTWKGFPLTFKNVCKCKFYCWVDLYFDHKICAVFSNVRLLATACCSLELSIIYDVYHVIMVWSCHAQICYLLRKFGAWYRNRR